MTAEPGPGAGSFPFTAAFSPGGGAGQGRVASAGSRLATLGSLVRGYLVIDW